MGSLILFFIIVVVVIVLIHTIRQPTSGPDPFGFPEYLANNPNREEPRNSDYSAREAGISVDMDNIERIVFLESVFVMLATSRNTSMQGKRTGGWSRISIGELNGKTFLEFHGMFNCYKHYDIAQAVLDNKTEEQAGIFLSATGMIDVDINWFLQYLSLTKSKVNDGVFISDYSYLTVSGMAEKYYNAIIQKLRECANQNYEISHYSGCWDIDLHI